MKSTLLQPAVADAATPIIAENGSVASLDHAGAWLGSILQATPDGESAGSGAWLGSILQATPDGDSNASITPESATVATPDVVGNDTESVVAPVAPAPTVIRIEPAALELPPDYVEIGTGDRNEAVTPYLQLLGHKLTDLAAGDRIGAANPYLQKMLGHKLPDLVSGIDAEGYGGVFKAIACKDYPQEWTRHNKWGYENKDGKWNNSTPIFLVTDKGVCLPQRIDHTLRKQAKEDPSLNPAALVRAASSQPWYLRPLSDDEVKKLPSNDEAKELPLRLINQRGWGIYAHIHGIAHGDCEGWSGTKVTPRVLVFEFDNLSMSDQVGIIVGLPVQPNFLVTTGKSIHAYYIVDGMDWAVRADLQKRLVAHLDGSDTKICDAPRLMRVPGFDHVAYDADTHAFKMTRCRLFVRSDAAYTVADIDSWLPPLSDDDKRSSQQHKRSHTSSHDTKAKRSHDDRDDTDLNSCKRKPPIDRGSLPDSVKDVLKAGGWHRSDRVLSAIPYIPVRVAGENTYHQFIECYWALKNTYGTETADALMADKIGDLSDSELSRIRNGDYNFSLGSLFHHAKANGWVSDKIEINKPNALSMDSTIREIFRLLNEEDDHTVRFYQQGNTQHGYTPVRLVQQETAKSRGYRGYTIAPLLTAKDWAGAVNEYFVFFERTEDSEGNIRTYYYRCPSELAEGMRTFNDRSSLWELQGISHIPTIRSDGSLSKSTGYEPDSRLLLKFDLANYANVPDAPSRNDAESAIACIKELLEEFPFVSDLDRSCALSLLLTAVTRKCYKLAPMHVINAASPGTGKSTLAEIAIKLLLGDYGAASTMAWDAKEDEMAKKLLAVLGAGAQVVNLDNCNKVSLRGSALESILTSEFYSGRVLGQTAMLTVPNKALWIANGNHVGVVSDAIRRTIGISLESDFDDASDREFKRDIMRYVAQNRPNLVGALLTVVMAYLRSLGTPCDEHVNGAATADVADATADLPMLHGDDAWQRGNRKVLPSYEQWDLYVRQPLVWLGEPDPVASQKLLKEEDPNEIRRGDFLSLVHSVLGDREWTAADLAKVAIDREWAAADPAKVAIDQSMGRDARPEVVQLQDHLQEHYGTGLIGFDTKKLGYWLKIQVGVRTKGYRLDKGSKGMQGVRWRVRSLQG